MVQGVVVSMQAQVRVTEVAQGAAFTPPVADLAIEVEGLPEMVDRLLEVVPVSAHGGKPVEHPGLAVRVVQPACRSEEHTSELQSHRDLHSFPTRRSSDLAGNGRSPPRSGAGLGTRWQAR